MARRSWVAMRAAADRVIADVRKAKREQAMGQPFSAAACRWSAARRAALAEAVARRVAGKDATKALLRFNALQYQDFLQ